MALTLGRGTLIAAQSGGLILTDGFGQFLLNDGSQVTGQVGTLTMLDTAIVPMTPRIVSVSQHGECLANFTVEETGPLMQFTDASYADGSGGPIDAWAWDFGDGSTSLQQSPEHAYVEAGVFPVKLTVTDAHGNISYATLAVIVQSGGSFLIWDYAPTAWDQNDWA